MRRRLVIDQPIVRRERDRKPKRPPKKGQPKELSPKERAQELVDKGMPYQMAMAVVHGKMELNEALERLARRDRVNGLMERYDLSRALATQVALGHADLDQILRRRRMKAHREAHRDRTCLVPGAVLTVATFGGEIPRATVEEVAPYTAVLRPEGGEPVEVHKLEMKYAYDPEDWKKVRKALKRDKRVAEQGFTVAERPQDRYTCSDRRLFGYVDDAPEVQVTLVDGDSLRGVITWFSRFEFGLRVKGDAEIVVFRHALHDLGLA